MRKSSKGGLQGGDEIPLTPGSNASTSARFGPSWHVAFRLGLVSLPAGAAGVVRSLGHDVPFHLPFVALTAPALLLQLFKVLFRIRVGHSRLSEEDLPTKPSPRVRRSAALSPADHLGTLRRAIRWERGLLVFWASAVWLWRSPHSGVQFAVATGTFIVIWVVYVIVSVQIRDDLRALSVQPLTYYFRSTPLFPWFPRGTVDRVVSAVDSKPLTAAVDRATKIPRNGKLSPFALAISWSLGFAVSSAGASVVAPPPPSTQKAPAKEQQSSAPGVDEQGRSQAAGDSDPVSQDEATFESECGIFPAMPPGSEWASGRMKGLYFQGGPGGTTGCPAQPTVIKDAFDEVVIQRNVLDGQLGSVAIVSRTGRDAVLYDEAARVALAQLEDGKSLNGIQRHDVGNGDAYLLYTGSGTTLLIRYQKRLPAKEGGGAAPYNMLSPRATKGWFEAMQAANKWLWPVRVDGRSVASTITFELWSSPIRGKKSGLVVSDRDPFSPGGSGNPPITWDSVTRFAQAA